jgi:chaperone required for assembly of F1-ATPase
MLMALGPTIFAVTARPTACHGSNSVAAHNHAILMREILSDIFENQPLDPREAARRGGRPALRKRFYSQAHVAEGEGGFALLLDGKPVKTPARRPLAAPARALAEKIAGEWNTQADVIDPGRMPLTRLANAAIDAVADAPQPVAEEVAQYLGSDLLCYRAEAPAGLVELQSRHWDPVLAWARDALGARFILAQGIMHVAQPIEAVSAARAKIPADPWNLAAVSSITTLTGSGLLALALAQGTIDADAAWAAAHVDEDWQMSQWGDDRAALDRRAYRRAEFEAAATVLRSL